MNFDYCERCGLPVKHKDDHWHALSCEPALKKEVKRLQHENNVLRELNAKNNPQAAEWRDEGGDDQC